MKLSTIAVCLVGTALAAPTATLQSRNEAANIPEVLPAAPVVEQVQSTLEDAIYVVIAINGQRPRN